MPYGIFILKMWKKKTTKLFSLYILLTTLSVVFPMAMEILLAILAVP